MLLQVLPTSWLAKNIPNAVQKEVNGIGYTTDYKVDENGKKRTKGTKPGQINFWRSTEDGPYKGMTDGKQKIRRNPEAMKDVSTSQLLKLFANGNTVTEIRRNGLDKLGMALGQELGFEIINKELQQYINTKEKSEVIEMFKERQDLLGAILNENFAVELIKQTERGNVKESQSPSAMQQGLDLISLSMKEGFLTPNFIEKANKNGVPTKLIIALANSSFAENLNIDGAQDLKTPIKNLIDNPNIDESLKKAIKEWTETGSINGKTDKHDKATIKLANSLSTLVTKLPPQFFQFGTESEILRMFGFMGSSRYFGDIRASKAVQKAENRLKNKIKAKRKAKVDKKQKLPFDPSKIRFFNAGYGLMDKIQTIQDMDITAEEKRNMVEKEYGQEIADANENNWKMLQYMHGQFLDLAIKDPSNITGLLMWAETQNTNTLGPHRALSALNLMQMQDGSQAIFIAEVGGKTKYYHNKSKIPPRAKNVRVNEKHPDYEAAFNLATELAIKKSKKNGFENDQAWIAEETQNLIWGAPGVAGLLRQKGEHVTPSANNTRSMVMQTINTVNELIKNPNNTNAKQEWRDKTEVLLKKFEQSLATKTYSDLQDMLLTRTSALDRARLVSIMSMPDVDINSLSTIDGRSVKEYINESVFSVEQLKEAGRIARELDITTPEQVKRFQKIDKAVEKSRESGNPPQGITVLDFDDTLATTKSRVITIAPDGTRGYMNAEQYAKGYTELAAQGYKFDFSEFSKVIKGKIAPLFQKALKLQGKFGPENMFVLTARPADSAIAIHEFLKANGLNIPLKNITGLANSTSEAKALWIADKVAEGYNDFYFADDALQNVEAVKNMLDQFDVKSKVQQARAKYSENPSGVFNQIIEETFGVEAFKQFSPAKARQRGKSKGRFDVFIPPGAEDFKGLLYGLLAKGEKGEKQLEFFNEMLMKPFSRASQEIDLARVQIMSDYKKLRKEIPEVRKKLNEKVPGTEYSWDTAIRVYLWNKAGFDVPGLSKTDLSKLLKAVEKDAKTKLYAETLGKISKIDEGWTQPNDYWLTENIASDMTDIVSRVHREQSLKEFKENRRKIFGTWENGKLVGPNMNKLEAVKGIKYREALEDMLWRMENGTNRNRGNDRLTNAFQNWINGSIGAIMFFNQRSALLQLISSVNYVNYADNNPVAAAKAFANQKQYWKDFVYLWNSPTLVARRAGLRGNIETSEIALAAEKGGPKAVFAYMLKLGFTPTQIADSFAISSGGAAMYRNRVNKYLKEGLSKKEAETKAFEDFNEITQENQQSSRADKISQQQAGSLGRFVLAFQNTPMQYTRLSKRDIQDLINRRRIPGKTLAQSDKIRLARIGYYMAVQNMIFGALQSALFRFMFEEDDEEQKKKEVRVANGMLDTILRGMGVGGAIVSTFKNMIMKFIEQEKKKNFDESAVVLEFLNLSPPIGSKARKIVSAMKTLKYQRNEIEHMSKLNINNPIWQVIGNITSGITNIPLDRVVSKLTNIKEASDSDNAWWQRLALINGWNTWDLGVTPDDLEEAREEIEIIKSEKKIEKKEADKKRKEEERLEKLRQGKFDYLTDEEFEVVQKTETLTKLNKSDQVNMLMELGLSSTEIKKLKYEADRVNKIIELTKKQ